MNDIARILTLATLVLGAHAQAAPDTLDGRIVRWRDTQGRTRIEPARATTASLPAVAAVTNHVENGTFGSDSQTGRLRAWTYYETTPGAGNALAWDALDVNASATSGSALVVNDINNENGFRSNGISQCVSHAPDGLSASAQVYIPADQPYYTWEQFRSVIIEFRYYSDDGCQNEFFPDGAFGTGWLISPLTVGVWKPMSVNSVSSADAHSVRVVVFVEREAYDVWPPNRAHFDSLALTTPTGVLWRQSKGDFDRDGETDLVVHNTVTGENALWPMQDEQRVSVPAAITPSPDSLDWHIAGTADFDGDGQHDLLMWNSTTGEAEFWLLTGTARVGPPVVVAGTLGPVWRPSATADFNNDGRPDIVWRNSATQKLSVWTMNGTSQAGTLTPSPDQAVADNWEIVSAQDLNGDGTPDFLWYNVTSGKLVYWWMGASLVRISGNFTTPANAGDNNWRVVAGGDYGIGPSGVLPGVPNTQDIVWRNQTSGRVVVWFMDTAARRTAGVFVTPDAPAPATDWTVVGPR